MNSQRKNIFRNQVQESIDKIQHYFREKSNIAALYLFGSTAQDKAEGHSDLDVAVMFGTYVAEKDGLDFLGYIADMEGIAVKQVDIVCFNTADPLLKHQILKYGKLLIDNDPESRVRLMVKAMADYEDYKRHLDLSFHTLQQEMRSSE